MVCLFHDLKINKFLYIAIIYIFKIKDFENINDIFQRTLALLLSQSDNNSASLGSFVSIIQNQRF